MNGVNLGPVLDVSTLTSPTIQGTVGAGTGLTMPAFTLGGAITGGDQSFTNVGDMTFAAGSILASGGTNGNTLLLRANDTTFITLTTGTTDVCTADAITMSGTWLASGTVTLPAFTAGGDITLGANKLRTTDYLIKQSGALLTTRNAADDANADWSCATLRTAAVENSGDFIFTTSTTGIYAPNTDNAYLSLLARDNGVGRPEVARLQGAADPYFQMTLAMRLNPIATASLPATPVEGMLVYDDTANKLKVYNGSAWETVTSAV